ncbi:EF-hand domain-containing protein [Planctomycetes bacterium TBK1r]|uniref:EF hand n=1 Tax=Stieleria magnilauensis TaxID=2527963 RepID=A0ABX5XTY1_9BACT|nr:EF hand [Planctomycetes bacterium TBK1r]
MKRLSLLTVFCALALLLSESLANAQPPGGRPGQGGGRQGAGPGGGRGPGMGGPNGQPRGQQTPPLLRIFDADGDGELSPNEIDAASVALRKLDRNGDGKLTTEEFRPTGTAGSQGRQGSGRGAPRGAMQGGQPGPGRPGAGGRPAGGGGRGGDPAQADTAFAEQIMAFDENKDGSLDKSELPEHMHQAFAIADANQDGSLDEAERLVLASQFRRNKLNPTGDAPVNSPSQAGPRAGGQRGAGQARPGQGGRPRDRVRPRDIEFSEKFPIGAELPEDLQVYNVDRKLVPVNSIFQSKYTVIVGGCLTCPEFRNSYPEIEAVARDFKDRGVDFYFLYQSLTHPENWGFVQPSSIEDRFAQVDHAKELLQTQIPWLTDPIDNQLKTYFVLTPNSQFVFDRSGKVVHRNSWGRGSSLRESLEPLVGKPETLTTVQDLNLPRFERHLTPQSEMLLERVSVEGKAIALRVESGGETNPVSALRSIDFHPSNRYVKLRPEADRQLLETGTGTLYLGFRQDPVLGASWNNLASPPEYKIVADGATVSPATGHSKRLDVESDNEPREFLVDVKDWHSDEPISVKIQYFACNKEKGWCKSVQQEFTVWLDEDESAGMVNGRSHFPGGGRRRN